jgi:perosamine synthetase
MAPGPPSEAHGTEPAKDSIPVSRPELLGNEPSYVQDALRSTWISSKGPYVERFEATFAQFCGAAYAIACNTGTAALHLTLLALGIGPGDEVIVPTLTYIASANVIHYSGATPVFVDSNPHTWNLDPECVADAITRRTRAIIAVHLYGEPADMTALRAIADDARVALVEDAAEAHGAQFDGRAVGGLGDLAAFSFYGNKIVTTGEGGMVVTNDAGLAERVRLFGGQGQQPGTTYWFPVVGHNYRMTNIEAAIGLAQLERIEAMLEARSAVAARYRERFTDVPGLMLQATHHLAERSDWIVGALLPERVDRDAVAERLLEAGIETRPFFYPVHTMPAYSEWNGNSLPVAEDLARRGICLPTYAGLEPSQIDRVCDALIAALGERG